MPLVDKIAFDIKHFKTIFELQNFIFLLHLFSLKENEPKKMETFLQKN